ncbi:dTDP-4-dehydrorhamnose 3,5-epimerase [Arachidicoccus ginsenosidimutans]|uniref:dTDP-4-dehydrorhamnose 3,5-epimerase n=1 Tax=Arachidicoccus sp. BS20 TaxID=1850526 RepID=UPI0007F06176|nr:dTDP-4-dehydrorhamnose 3,5-epimerase [Arachidicoccus sp. BS20]ANI88861.1 dTDP-4-dehydrorhamnose 3,5-epimerase [Arachidicoccus sp. BS20]
MHIEETKLKGCFLLQPKVFKDDRGYFFESFNQKVFEEATGSTNIFVQDNQSFSTYGTIRGLHFQQGEFAQAKLVRVIQGKVLDVAVDLRKDSPTYGEWVSAELTDENNLQLYIPRGFAHGFSVLSETAIFSYKCDNYYNKASEGGLRFDDATLNIDWKIPLDKVVVSEKDKVLPTL